MFFIGLLAIYWKVALAAYLLYVAGDIISTAYTVRKERIERENDNEITRLINGRHK